MAIQDNNTNIDGGGGFLGGLFSFLGGNGVKDAYAWGQKRPQGPQIGPNPYQGDWNGLISQLQQQASGQGPSLAGNAYNQASQDSMRQSQAMFRGGSAGAARAGAAQMGQNQQGLQAGYANARLAEQMAARSQLQGALSGAGNAWFAPQQSNLAATMGTPTNMQTLLSFLQNAGAAAGKMSGAGV
jgi:hypothetical protein